MTSDDSAPGDPTDAPKVREPIFDAPPVVVLLVVVLIVAYLAVSMSSEPSAIDVRYGFVPARQTFLFEGLRGPSPGEDFLVAKPWTLLTYAFVHGSWTHVGLNAVWIIAFGPPVARRVGTVRFLALFAATAVAGALVHWAFNMTDYAPLIGASAVDSGLMAAAARFIFEPGGPLGGSDGYSRASPVSDYRAPALPLRRLLRERNVVIFLIIWLATNFIFGAGAQDFGLSEAPVAWLAHLGGFVVGFFLFPLFDRSAPVRR